MPTQPSPVNVFLLFDDKDFDIIREIENHCASLKREKRIEVWHHKKIGPGQIIEQEAMRNLKKADVILLMISANLLNSERFYEVEKASLERSRARRSIVIPVYLKHCLFTGYEFTELQMLPSDGNPVALPDTNLDERCLEIAREIHNLVDTLEEIKYADAEEKATTGIPFANNGDTLNILYLTNDPEHANAELMNEEINCIKHRLLLGKCSCQYELIPKNVNDIEGLQRALLETRPRIVHFSGYSTSGGHLLFRDSNGAELQVSPDALCSLFSLFNEQLELVFLNTCYSEPQAEAISGSVGRVIGVKGEIEKQIALNFVNGFYQAISYGTSIEKAYRLARNLLQLKNEQYYDKIVMLGQREEDKYIQGSDIARS